MMETRLGEALEVLIDHRGKTPKKLGSDFTPGGVPVASALLVSDGVLNLRDARYVSDETYAKWMQVPTRKGDVLLTSEAPLGRVAQVPSDEPLVLGQRLFALRGKPGILHNGYLFYALQTSRVRADLLGRATGTTVVGIRQSALLNVQLSLPGFHEQQAIAEVLGALDDKIAANTKLAETADALAVSEFQKSLLTAAYSESTFADLARVSGGGTPSTKVPEYWDGNIPWATPTDITGLQGPYLEETSRTISEAGLAACSSELFPAETILMTSRATIGAFALTQTPTAVNQGFIVVQAYDPDIHFWLFHEMRGRVDEFISMANGATFLELSRGNFKKFKVRLAGQSEMKAFNETARTLHQTAREALRENRILAATRDTLLPQLMSGKLRVKDVEHTMGEMV